MKVASLATVFPALLLIIPNKNKPSIPPAKIPASCHQRSRILFTPIIIMPVIIAKTPMAAVDT